MSSHKVFHVVDLAVRELALELVNHLGGVRHESSVSLSRCFAHAINLIELLVCLS